MNNMKQLKETKIELCSISAVNAEKVMNAKKHILQQSHLHDMAELFKIMGDPTRLKIIFALQKEELCVCELASLLQVTLPAISYQLRILRTTRLVKFRRQGKMVYYSLDDHHVEALLELASQHMMEG